MATMEGKTVEQAQLNPYHSLLFELFAISGPVWAARSVHLVRDGFPCWSFCEGIELGRLLCQRRPTPAYHLYKV
jgi:hypothetical protein